MESSTSEKQKEAQRQAELRQQIALLQSQLTEDVVAPPVSPKRKTPEPVVLAPATPSPKKRKPSRDQSTHVSKNRPLQTKRPAHPPPAKSLTGPSSQAPPPTNFISSLNTLRAKVKDESDTISRSSAFDEKPAVPLDDVNHPLAPDRDDRLALVEDLEPGPIDHKPPFDDPHFQALEPNSGIRLSSRKLPHEDLQEYLTGRYYLSPSRLYSVIRLLPSKQGYDVPVAGDWVTIAVIAERGPIKLTTGGVSNNDKDSDNEGDNKSSTSKRKKQDDDSKPKRPSGKKYINLKLVDFGHRSRSSSNGKATIKGDALLTLLLFESDTFDRIKDENGNVRKLYKGGSRGAFENFAKLREGMVVALLNPKILKPFQRAGDTPHPHTNILALTPESAQSIAIIGQAQDLGMCGVMKRDGRVCGGWCDKRVSDVCEYHVQTAVQSRRANRPEFSIGTSGMSTFSGKRKADYDPLRHWGMKPEPKVGGGGEATYVLSGHVVSAGGPEYIHESIGREGQAKAKRKMDARETEKMLSTLANRDRSMDGAAEVVKRARLAKAKKSKKSVKASRGKGGKGKDAEDGEDDTGTEPENETGKKHTYPVTLIKNLGFDPTLKAGQKRNTEGKLGANKLDNLLAPRREIQLGPPPGPRIRSVAAPLDATGASTSNSLTKAVKPAEDSDDDWEMQEDEIFGRPHLLLSGSEKEAGQPGSSNYDSDSDLEVVP